MFRLFANLHSFDVKCMTLAHEAKHFLYKSVESILISARNPDLNGRDECLSITGDFLFICLFMYLFIARHGSDSCGETVTIKRKFV